MQHVRQPAGSKLCGHACVAMVCGVTLERAVEVIGHTRGTNWWQLSLAIEALGGTADPHLTIISRSNRDTAPEVAIYRIHWGGPRDGSHWTVRDGPRWLDPLFGEGPWAAARRLLRTPELSLKRDRRVVSFARCGMTPPG